MSGSRYHWFNNPINSRYYLPDLLALMNLYGEGVEVGACEGFFSEALLQRSTLRMLYLVDPWKVFPKEVYVDTTNVSQEEHEKNYINCVERLKPFRTRSSVLRMTSMEAVLQFDDNSLEFANIDANHRREEVVKDLNAWYPKIKKGGIFSGHDYLPDGEYNHGTFGVKSAVDEFTYKHNENLLVCQDELWPTWYFIKSGTME